MLMHDYVISNVMWCPRWDPISGNILTYKSNLAPMWRSTLFTPNFKDIRSIKFELVYHTELELREHKIIWKIISPIYISSMHAQQFIYLVDNESLSIFSTHPGRSIVRSGSTTSIDTRPSPRRICFGIRLKPQSFSSNLGTWENL